MFNIGKYSLLKNVSTITANLTENAAALKADIKKDKSTIKNSHFHFSPGMMAHHSKGRGRHISMSLGPLWSTYCVPTNRTNLRPKSDEELQETNMNRCKDSNQNISNQNRKYYNGV